MGLRRVAKISRDEARRLFRKAKRDVLFEGKSRARKTAKTARQPVGPERSGAGYRHYYDSERSGGHSFFNAVAGGIGLATILGSDANQVEASMDDSCGTGLIEPISKKLDSEGSQSVIMSVLTGIVDFFTDPKTAE
ncbi:MAG: hypothetical protein L0387_19725 [Acidobacteria bacterium]|nr:hypothetical protein [Acidobacteriota bacterium]